ncbi:MAG: hypothetical protein AAGI38_20955 [Bacteroidota bacterium]
MYQRYIAQQIKAHYPKALDSKDLSIKYLGKMQNDYDIDISKMLLATSLCSDDINIPSTSFFNVLFGPFIMGGLGGLPFAGMTGMGAYASHIPDGGSAFIFYGPHIGITMDGELGKMYRPRQDKATSSCGALMLAMRRFQENPKYEPTVTDADYQQMKLEESLVPYKEEILASKEPAKEITSATYEVIHKQIYDLVEASKGSFKVDKIAMLGGIIINTSAGLDDFFDVRNFEVVEI